MTTEQIKEIRDTFQGVPGVVIKIILDNSIIFHGNLKGQVLLWDDAKKRLTCIRENTTSMEAPQRLKPWEITVTSYEHIQYMIATVDIDNVEKYLDAISYSNKDKLIKYLSSQKVSKSSITGSTGDGIDWDTAKKDEDK